MAGALRIVLRVLVVVLAVYCATDPFKQGSMAGFPGFETYFVHQPDWSEVPSVRDTEDKLQKAEIRFQNQIQGPESIAFDPLGRGPYTGVADGRVVFWDGSTVTDFAYTSPNRFVQFIVFL
jgi:Adipocyte plasma membrane-associated protein-like, N-terminal